MKISLHIAYHTDQEHIVGVIFDNQPDTLTLLQRNGENADHWTTTLSFRANQKKHHTYQYVLTEADGKTIVRKEKGNGHPLFTDIMTSYECHDSWKANDIDETFVPEHFFKVTEFGIKDGRNEYIKRFFQQHSDRHILLMLESPALNRDDEWCVCGNCDILGNWQVENALSLTPVSRTAFACLIPKEYIGAEYKYVIRDKNNHEDAVWEQGDNRSIKDTYGKHPSLQNDYCPYIEYGFSIKRIAGTVIPVFSLRSKESQGIGDFGDLAMFTEWAATAGMHAVQLLPVNDTTSTNSWRDSYPYSSISVFALHPAYLDLREWKHLPLYAEFAPKFEELNAAATVDYDNVVNVKNEFLRLLYNIIGDETMQTDEYKNFCKDNEYWLPAYCMFSHLRDRYHTADFSKWKDFTIFNKSNYQNYLKRSGYAKSVMFFAFVQYLLHRQLSAAHDKANTLGIILKGDIPIGVAPRSVATWVMPHLFHMNGSAGAPPDYFSKDGQNWGFPTYNWEVMARDGYDWWKKRFRHMHHYFDAYRIDHVLGFFRIWEIPRPLRGGILGHFRPALPFTASELSNRHFNLDAEELCLPSLADWNMAHFTDYEKKTYFDWGLDHRFRLKKEFANEQKIRKQVQDETLLNKLIDFTEEVLFVHDPDNPKGYHPCISAYATKRFNELTEDDRNTFNALHDDFFYHRHNEFWAREAMKKLPAIVQSESNMLACAEDLGMVPPTVKDVLGHLHILSLEIQRMPKRSDWLFDNPAENPPLSVCTISTHDMAPLRKWWIENTNHTADAYWREVLHENGDTPSDPDTLTCERILSIHLASPSILCLLAWQNWSSIDENLRSENPMGEQINDPANPNQFWNYRMEPTIETLLMATPFTEKVRALIKRNGR